MLAATFVLFDKNQGKLYHVSALILVFQETLMQLCIIIYCGMFGHNDRSVTFDTVTSRVTMGDTYVR